MVAEEYRYRRQLPSAADAMRRFRLTAVLSHSAQMMLANAARIAGRNRTEFYKLLATHNIDAADFRSDLKK